MQRFIGVLLLILDITLIPVMIIYYVLLTISLIDGCIHSKGNFKEEFKDFNQVFINSIKDGMNIHKERILGV